MSAPRSGWNPARRRLSRGWSWAIGFLVLLGVGAATAWMLYEQRETPPGRSAPDAPAVDVKAAARSTEDRPPVEAPRGEVVAGVVLAPDGRPAAVARVSLLRVRTAWPEWRADNVGPPAYTGADGRFQFRVDDRRGLLVAFEHPSFAGGLQEVGLDALAMRLQLQKGFELFGEVQTANGAPLANVRVALESVLADQRRVVVATTGANGGYRFTNLPPGPVRIVARHEAWLPVTVPVHVVGDVVRVNLAFQRAAAAPLGGRITSAVSLRPIEGVLVQLLPAGGRPGLADPIEARTAADGTFTVRGLPLGNMRLLVRHPEHGAVVRTVPIGNVAVDLGCELPSRSQVGGRLLGASSATAVGATIEIRDFAGQVERATVGRDGTFRFDAPLSPGSATLVVLGGVFAFERSGSREVSVRVEESATTQFDLAIAAPSLVRGRVVDADGKPLGGALVSQTKALAENARSIGTAITRLDIGSVRSRVSQLFGSERDEALALSRDDGTFEIRGLAPGALTVRVELAGRGSRWTAITVPAGSEPLDVGDVVLPPGCRIEGRVLRGRPLAGALVTAIGRESQAMTVSVDRGSFVFDNLQPGEYSIRARLPSMPNGSNEQRVNVVPGRAPPEFVLTLDTGRSLRGIVTGSDGQPVPGARVSLVGSAGQTTVSDENGDFVMQVPPRALELQVALPDRSRPVTVPVGAALESVIVRLDTPPTTRVTASVVGLPMRKRQVSALLRFVRLDDPSDAVGRTAWIELPNGELDWPLCPVGQVRLEIWCDGFAPHVVDREFVSGEPARLGEILLEPGARLVGEVHDAEDRAIANAAVWLGEESDTDLLEPMVRTAADGSFRISGVSSRSSRVVVRAPGFAPRTVDLALPADVLATAPMVIRLERGAVIEVAVERTAPMIGARVELWRAGRVVASADVDDGGLASFADRGPGDYEVALAGGDAAPKRVTVTAGAPSVRVRLP